MRSRASPTAEPGRPARGGAVLRARREFLAGGVTFAAITLFVGTGGRVSRALFGRDGFGEGDRMLAVALILNVALILFGWRRYRDLAAAAAEREQADARAATLETRDPLTGLPNRRGFADEASALLAQAERRRMAVAVLAIDLDHFRTVNGIHGHAEGDAMLRTQAERLCAALPPSAVAARLDGDRFVAALLFDPARGDTVDLTSEQVLARLSQPLVVAGASAHASASIGVARSEDGTWSLDALLRRAEIATRQAKLQGRGRAVRFDASMERELLARSALEAGIRAGVPRGEIVPYYEQQIDLLTGRLLGFEVLARWQHPNGDVVAPDLFIPVAEEAGLIGELSLSVMRQAFEEAKSWDPSLTLSVNISPAQLKDPWLAQKIVRLLVETGFPANRLEIEITETALFANLGLAQSIVASLKNQGIRLALDDFGTGYSSLAHLRALPFDRIKIDKSFVTAINSDGESAAIVDAIARLGDSLGLPITAEGIEDAAISERLMALGCTKGQGWHYGKPMPVGATRRLLAEQGLLPSARGADDAAGPARRRA